MFPLDLTPGTAYSLAGHAVAITLGNPQKQLPEVYYRICLAPGLKALKPQSALLWDDRKRTQAELIKLIN